MLLLQRGRRCQPQPRWAEEGGKPRSCCSGNALWTAAPAGADEGIASRGVPAHATT